MKNFLFMGKVLDKFNDVEFIKKLVIICLRVVAGLISLGGLFFVFALLSEIFRGYLGGATAFLGLIFTLIFGIIVYMVVHVILIRANNFKNLGLKTYPILTIIAKLVKVMGEVYITFILPITILLGIFIIFSSGDNQSYLLLEPFTFTGAFGFISHVYYLEPIDGLLVIFFGFYASLVAFFTTYGLSELIKLLTYIGRNTRKIL